MLTKKDRITASAEVQRNRFILSRIVLPDLIMGTISSSIAILSVLLKIIVPVALGIAAILSPAVIFALSCTDLAISLIWWAHAHYDMYHTCKPLPKNDAENKPEPLWRRIKNHPVVNHLLTFSILALFNTEASISIFFPTLLGIASPILVLVAFSVLSARCLFDAIEATYLHIRDPKSKPLKHALWTWAGALAVMGLTIATGFLLFSPAGPAAMLAIGISILVIQSARLVLRLINPTVSIKTLKNDDGSSTEVELNEEPSLAFHASLHAAQKTFGKKQQPQVVIEPLVPPPTAPTPKSIKPHSEPPTHGV